MSRTILVVTAVSSINTRRVVSSQPCSRIQRRRARATSARLRSSARRLFFECDAMASEESRQCAAARRDPPLTQHRNELIQSKVPLLADKGENLLRILLQRGRAPSTGHRFARPIFAKALQPADRGTRADLRQRHVGIPLPSQTRSRELSSPQDTVPALVGPPANQCVRFTRLARLGNPDSLPLGPAVTLDGKHDLPAQFQ